MRVGQWPVGVVQLAPSAGNRRLRVGEGIGRTCQQNSRAREGNRDMGTSGRGKTEVLVGLMAKGPLISLWTDW